MYIAFNKFDELERPVVTLTNPNKTEVGVLGLANQIRPTFNFNALSELTFNYPYKNIDDEYSPYYDELIEYRLIHLENYGWWIISSVNDTDDGVKKGKEITAYSLEYELASKKLNLFNGTYKFYDPVDYKNCLLGIVLKGTGWSIDYVDSDLWNKFRTFDVATDTVYSFLMNTASQKYECIFVFDTDNRKVSAYTPSSIVEESDIFLGYDNVVKQLQVKAVAQELVTAMSVYGDEDINIALANPLGTVTMYNYDYFKSDKWMSLSLVDKINQWEADIESEKDRYRNALLNLIESNRSNTELEAALYELESQLKALEEVQALQISGNIPSSDPTTYQETLDNITSVKSDIAAQKKLIGSGEVDANTFKETLTYINDKLKRENYFTSEELIELIPYTLESTYQDDGFIVTDIMTNAEKQQVAVDLYDKSCEVMEKISQPTYEITVDSINYFAIPVFKIFGQQTQLGTSMFVEIDRDNFTKCILLSIQFNFDDPTDFSLTLGNRYRLTSAEWTYSDLFNDSLNTNATVNWSYSGMREWQGYKDQYTDFVNGALDATKNEIINSTNQEVTITSAGLRGRKLLNSGDYDDKQWWFANNTLAFTRDNWNSVSLALGEITLPDEEYNKELERIMNVSGELYKIKLDTENYRYPAYVAIDGYNHCYEYVLVDEDQRRFVYVYTEWITNQKNIKFNTEYLPIFWNSTPDGNNFCIYFENIYESTEVPESADDGINY